MNRRFIFGAVIALLLLNLAVGAKIYTDTMRIRGQAASEDSRANLDLVEDVLHKIKYEYVDGTNLTYRQLVYSALKGAVSRLDPHSEFLDPESFHQLEDDTEGQFGGLGLVVALRGGFVTVVSPMDDTPGSRAGILAGDRILKVDGRNVEHLALDAVVKQLRGQPGSTVIITVERPTSGIRKEYTLKRAAIQMVMVKDINGKKEFPLDANKLGYVRILQFSEKTSDELEDALDKLKHQGMQGLVIDLRYNPGGLLDQAVEVCEKFLPRDQLVVSTEGRHTVEKYFARGHGDELKGLPIVILVNLSSASAAEIVTGCLQDLHRAVVLGEKTFGKGSVQTIFPLDDGAALKLTVAKYYTPSHKVIHQQGITPDIVVPISDTEEAALLVKGSPGGVAALSDKQTSALAGGDLAPGEDGRARIAAVRDRQLDRALDVLKTLNAYRALNVAGQ